ncbi:hypothetical protein I2I05_12300 [Hymenobacter sp. BT683]|uniref:Uncharacterized protein n=1 Tax=Hymenobacter jeongseonensis TaxID=2791027 RepID=A0ABS0IIK3_9BACT|nr:hypothetical protein [Hymenobacter jeongseonensis]MBF9238177.1 hypothetical protein [Hymenobacter jeongseonensis]
MLTVEKLAILIKYHWNFRQFEKQATVPEKALMADIDWDDLSEILQDLKRYHHHLVSTGYAQQIHANLLAVCADEDTAQTFIGYASTL